MNANEVIECYVAEVAVQLPRAQRNDVAFELRALIHDGLQDRAGAAGQPVDAAMALDFLRTLGRPAEVAARYRPAVTVIDPADGHAFLRATFIGLAVIWGLGAAGRLLQPAEGTAGWLGLVAQWWVGTVIPSLWWPGALVLGFAASAWARRRWPPTTAWTPRAPDRIGGGRGALVLGLAGVVVGIATLVHPRWLLDAVWGGLAAPSAYAALAYAEGFPGSPQAMVLLALLCLNIPLMLAAIVQGRWPAPVRRAQDALAPATVAAMAWAIAGRPIMATPAADSTAKGLMVLIAAATLVHFVVVWLRRVRPSPQVG
ncbi:MAG: hypothetical protein HY856_02440 [Burkholderiales bacterium]|nr:hypothetical protein [Burkholderiales bacterium]